MRAEPSRAAPPHHIRKALLRPPRAAGAAHVIMGGTLPRAPGLGKRPQPLRRECFDPFEAVQYQGRVDGVVMMRVLAGLCSLLAVALGLHGGAAAQAERDVLPSNAAPVRYDLHLAPNAEALTFSGELKVTVSVTAATRDITLNA